MWFLAKRIHAQLRFSRRLSSSRPHALRGPRSSGRHEKSFWHWGYGPAEVAAPQVVQHRAGTIAEFNGDSSDLRPSQKQQGRLVLRSAEACRTSKPCLPWRCSFIILEWTHVLRSTRKQNAALCLDGFLRLIFQRKHSPWPAQWTAPCRAADCSKPVAGDAGQQCSHVQKVPGAAFPVHSAADLLVEA